MRALDENIPLLQNAQSQERVLSKPNSGLLISLNERSGGAIVFPVGGKEVRRFRR